MTKKIIQFFIYFLSGLILTYVMLQSLLMVFYGVPTNPIQFIAFFSAIGLVISSFTIYPFPNQGRTFAIIFIIGIGIFFIPVSISLVPAHDVHISPLSYAIFFAYFGLLFFSLFYPQRLKFSIHLLAIPILISTTLGSYTFFNRYMHGEYSWPSMTYIRLKQDNNTLAIGLDPYKVINEDIVNVLKNENIKGTLQWSGGGDVLNNNPKLVVICATRIPEDKKLYFPRNGTLIYFYDGKEWKMFPENMSTFDKYATLGTDGRISESLVNGTRSIPAFYWR